MSNQNFPKQILEIQKFITNCEYDTIQDEKYIYYRKPKRIEKEKKCVCFDGTYYAYSKIKQLFPQFNPQIISVFGIKNQNGKKITKAHSICVLEINNKFGCVGKSSQKNMEFREPIYNSIEQLMLTFFKPFFEINIWPTKYQIEDNKNFHLLETQDETQLLNQNQIFANTKPKTFVIKPITVGQYLSEIEKIDIEQISEILESIK